VFNLGKFENELEGNYGSVCEEKTITVATDSMDGHTILCIQNAGVSPTDDPLYHLRGQEMESHICHNENL